MLIESFNKSFKSFCGAGWGKYININPGFTGGLDHLDQKTGEGFYVIPTVPSFIQSFILSIFLALFWECVVRARRRRRALKKAKDLIKVNSVVHHVLVLLPIGTKERLIPN